jgi:hypothetical protein
MNKSQFRSERSCRGWTEADEVPYWGKIGGRFYEFLRDVDEERIQGNLDTRDNSSDKVLEV